MSKPSIIALLVLSLFSLPLAGPVDAQVRYSGSEFSKRSPVFARNGVVSTATRLPVRLV